MSSSRSRKRQPEEFKESEKVVAYRKGLRDTLKVLNKGWVTVSELAVRLDSPTKSGKPLTKAATYSRLAKLKELGYVIEEKLVRVKSSGTIAVVFRCEDKSLDKLE